MVAAERLAARLVSRGLVEREDAVARRPPARTERGSSRRARARTRLDERRPLAPRPARPRRRRRRRAFAWNWNYKLILQASSDDAAVISCPRVSDRHHQKNLDSSRPRLALPSFITIAARLLPPEPTRARPGRAAQPVRPRAAPRRAHSPTASSNLLSHGSTGKVPCVGRGVRTRGPWLRSARVGLCSFAMFVLAARRRLTSSLRSVSSQRDDKACSSMSSNGSS